MNRILVTGSESFIGKELIVALKKKIFLSSVLIRLKNLNLLI